MYDCRKRAELTSSALLAVIFLGSFHDPQVIFEQLSLIYALPRYCLRQCVAVHILAGLYLRGLILAILNDLDGIKFSIQCVNICGNLY